MEPGTTHKSQKGWARFARDQIRRMGTQNSYAIQSHLREFATAMGAGVLPSAVGVDSVELENFRDAARREARIAVAEIRFGLNSGGSHEWGMITTARLMGLKSSDLGTSDEDLLNYMLRDAREKLVRLRAGIGEHDDWVLFHALKNGISFEDLETSAAEVDALTKSAKGRKARVALVKLRNGYGDTATFFSWIAAANEAGISLEDLGTSQEELDDFKSSG